MARDYISIGPCPPEEICVPLGADLYALRAWAECLRYRDLLVDTMGDPPVGASLRVKAFPHDFGTYLEVVCYYDEEDDEARNYAFKCESDGPQHWKES